MSSRLGRSLLAMMVALAIAGCSGAKFHTKASPQLGQYQVQKVVVVPFAVMQTPQVPDVSGSDFHVPEELRRSNISLDLSSTTEQAPRPATVPPAYAAEKVTNLVWMMLKTKPGLILIPPGDTKRALHAAAEDPRFSQAEAVGMNVAREVSADAALIGKVHVYQERVGSRLGADPPAAVGFELKLVAQDGVVIWVGNYYERQRPMTEDLWGFIQRWGVFVTADELARYGAEQLVREFPFGDRVLK